LTQPLSGLSAKSPPLAEGGEPETQAPIPWPARARLMRTAASDSLVLVGEQGMGVHRTNERIQLTDDARHVFALEFERFGRPQAPPD
jgi:hypothetical protein